MHLIMYIVGYLQTSLKILDPIDCNGTHAQLEERTILKTRMSNSFN